MQGVRIGHFRRAVSAGWGANSAHAQCNFLSDLECATEWSGGKIIDLGGLPGSNYSIAQGINDDGQVVGVSELIGGAALGTTEWSHGQVIALGGLPASNNSFAYGINHDGQVVGYSEVRGGPSYLPYEAATEWSHGQVIALGGLPGSTGSEAQGINVAGQVVGV